MKDKMQERRRRLLWALPTSLLLHALVVALLIYGLPRPPQRPPEEQAVSVALVPPPEPPKPKPSPAPSPKNLKAEKPPEQKTEKPPQPEKQPPKPAEIAILKPVFQFGDKDTGARKSLEGNSVQDNGPAPAKNDDSKAPVEAKDAENKSTAPSDSGEQADAIRNEENQDTPAQKIDKQEADVRDADKQIAAAPLVAPGAGDEVELPNSAEAPKPRPVKAPKLNFTKVPKPGSRSAKSAGSTDKPVAASQGYSGLPGVRKLYSQDATGDPLATTSMAGVPREQRAARLCASELQQQLLAVSYFPSLVPLVPLKAGNVVDVPDTAFRTRTTWYNLGFRCEVDTAATKVLSFTYQVGTAIPPEQWARLGLPSRF